MHQKLSQNRLFKKKALLLLLVFIISTGSALAQAITYLETQPNTDLSTTGASDVAVSPDGKFVYVASYVSNAVAIFSRNLATGRLTYVSKQTGISAAFSVDVSNDNKNVYVASPNSMIYAFSRNISTGALTLVNSLTGRPTGGFVSVSVSPDDKHVYGVGGSPSGLVVFGRDLSTGAISLLHDYQDNVDGHALGQQFSPTSSPIKNIVSSANGQFLYVTSTTDNAVTLFNRNATTGALTLVATYPNNVNGISGISGASSAKRSPDGKHLYVTGQGENSVAIFSINSSTGALTYVGKLTDGVNNVDKIAGARSLAISPDGRYVFVSAINDASITAFARDSGTGLLTLNTVVTHNLGGITGLEAPSGMVTDALNRQLYVAGQQSNGLVVFSLSTPSVQLLAAEVTVPYNGAATLVDPLLSIYDSDSQNLVSAIIKIETGWVSTDILSVDLKSGVTGSYDANTGVLNLQGVATLLQWQDILRSLRFKSGLDGNIGSGSSRTISFKVSDGENTSAAALIAVKVSNSVLPITLAKDFEAVKQVNGVKLNWATASETNNRGFMIFRSGEANLFTKLQYIPAKINSSTLQNYSYLDASPLNGINYYRLVQVDLDGKETVVGEKIINYQLSNALLSIYPNPTTDKVTIEFTANKYQRAKLINIQGESLMEQNILPGSSQCIFDMASLPSGTYLVQLSGTRGVLDGKIIRQ